MFNSVQYNISRGKLDALQLTPLSELIGKFKGYISDF